MRSRALLGALALLAALGAAPAATAGSCGGLLQPKCPPPAPPAPDPGGAESPDQPVPAPGRHAGFNSNLFRGGLATVEEELDAAKAAGATVHRLPLLWRSMQPTPGHAPIGDEGLARQTDVFYAEALARGITPVLIPFAAPGWATKYRTCGWLDFVCRHMQTTGGLALFPDWQFLDEYEAFVRAAKERWPRALIESWNSPNHYYKHPTYQGKLDFTAPPALFARIQCAAYRGSKQVNDDPVLAPGWAARLFVDYVGGVYEAGGADCWDRANLHVYPGTGTNFGRGTKVARTFRDARALRAAHGDDDPIWITETGYSTSGGHAVSEAAQADGLRRLYNRLATMPDVEAVIFHTLRDAATKDYSSTEHPEYGFGFMTTAWSPKPVYCHFSAMAGSPHPRC